MMQPGYQPQAPAPQAWQWRYIATTCSATLNGASLAIKQGIRTWNVEIAKLRHLYVRQTRNQLGTFDELLLSYEKAPGKNKVLRLYGNSGEAGMQAFIAALVAWRPDIDIRHMDARTAHKTMGAARMEAVAAVIAFLAVMLVMGVLLLPQGLHGIDFGEEHVAIDKLESGYAPDTHNLIITGHADLDDAMLEKTTHKGTTTVQYYVPIVSAAWTKAQPVHVVLRTDDLDSAAQDKLAHAQEFPGVVRDILWEGLGSDARTFFTGHIGLKLADDVKVVDYEEDPQFGLYVYVGVMGLTFLIMLGVMGYLWVKKRA